MKKWILCLTTVWGAATAQAANQNVEMCERDISKMSQFTTDECQAKLTYILNEPRVTGYLSRRQLGSIASLKVTGLASSYWGAQVVVTTSKGNTIGFWVEGDPTSYQTNFAGKVDSDYYLIVNNYTQYYQVTMDDRDPGYAEMFRHIAIDSGLLVLEIHGRTIKLAGFSPGQPEYNEAVIRPGGIVAKVEVLGPVLDLAALRDPFNTQYLGVISRGSEPLPPQNGSGEITLAELPGKYTVTLPLQPGVENLVTLTNNGTVNWVEKHSGDQSLTCVGRYNLDKDTDGKTTLVSRLTCANGRRFTQTISLAGLTLERLRAGVQTQGRSDLVGGGQLFDVYIRRLD